MDGPHGHICPPHVEIWLYIPSIFLARECSKHSATPCLPLFVYAPWVSDALGKYTSYCTVRTTLVLIRILIHNTILPRMRRCIPTNFVPLVCHIGSFANPWWTNLGGPRVGNMAGAMNNPNLPHGFFVGAPAARLYRMNGPNYTGSPTSEPTGVSPMRFPHRNFRLLDLLLPPSCHTRAT